MKIYDICAYHEDWGLYSSEYKTPYFEHALIIQKVLQHTLKLPIEIINEEITQKEFNSCTISDIQPEISMCKILHLPYNTKLKIIEGLKYDL